MGLTGPRREAEAGAGVADSLVVFLHGYGANGADLIGLGDALGPHLPRTRFLAPDAPQRCAGAGFQWFPIPWIDGSSEAARDAGIAAARAALSDLLDALPATEGIAPGRTALVGFSQGCMMALDVGLSRTPVLAGIVGMSGLLLRPPPAGDHPAVLLVHGDQDTVVPFARLGEAEAGLRAAGVAVETHVSRGAGHGIAPDGLGRALQFLAGRFA